MISVLSLDEMKKPKSKREPINASIDLYSDEPWDTLKAQILVKIAKAINPMDLMFDDYSLTYHITRLLPKPGLSLTSQEDFDGLLKRVNGMATKTPIVNISIIQVRGANPDANEKENEEDVELRRKEKSKKRMEAAAVLPGNEQKLANIQLLHKRWTCKKTDSACPSTHCYVMPETDEHQPLGRDWHGYTLGYQWSYPHPYPSRGKGTSEATLERPPNHRLFDMKRTAISPVLQRRLDAQTKATASAAAPLAPVFNFSLGNEFANLFRPAAGAQAQPPVALPMSGVTTISAQATLIPPTHKPGNDMSIADFCSLYKLDNTIGIKFTSQALKEARLLRYVTFADLKDMEFKFGEIAALRDAVEQWAVLL
ncbi:hypothetical protein BU15DRAFT_81189 [Melanogaster broomeanus]|nr:hypothetical protein BU15DRAFT_81189 [Melanogaster broomeanus]